MACALAGALLAACPVHAQQRPSPFEEIFARLEELRNGLETARGQFRKKKQATSFESVKDKLVLIVCGDKAGSGFVVRDEEGNESPAPAFITEDTFLYPSFIPLGAEKYTAWLAQYLLEHYALPDHRGDPAYASWDESFLRFSEEEAQARETVRALIESKAG